MEAMLVRPLFLLFCQRTIPALTAPFFASTANPAVKNLPIRKFDDMYTAPLHGYRGATDYYHRASAMRVYVNTARKIQKT